MIRPLPRFVRAKVLANGSTAFYWDLTGHYRRLGCSIPCEPLGTDYVLACGTDGNGGRAAALNALFDEWRHINAGGVVDRIARFGTVDWLFREYKQTKAYLEKVSARSRRDYERTMLLVTDLVTRTGDRVGARKIKAIHPFQPTRFMNSLSPALAVHDPDKGKRSSVCVRGRGASCIAFILMRSTEIFRTPGAA